MYNFMLSINSSRSLTKPVWLLIELAPTVTTQLANRKKSKEKESPIFHSFYIKYILIDYIYVIKIQISQQGTHLNNMKIQLLEKKEDDTNQSTGFLEFLTDNSH